MKIKSGFTLAEVLITICILGLIAALTLPALNSNIQKSAIETKNRKFYSQLNEGIRRYMAVNETEELDDSTFNPDEFIKQYLSVSQVCTEKTDTSCFADTYTNIDSQNTSYGRDELFVGNAYILTDGTTLSISQAESLDGGDPISVYVDVNGKKGPNIVGYDLQSMSIFYDGTIDEGIATPERRLNEDSDTIKKDIQNRFEACKTSTYGGCFGHLLRNDFKFDY